MCKKVSILFLSDCTVNYHLHQHQSLPNFELVNLTHGISWDALTTRTDESKLLMETIWSTVIKGVTVFAFIIITFFLSTRSDKSSFQWPSCSPPSNYKDSDLGSRGLEL